MCFEGIVKALPQACHGLSAYLNACHGTALAFNGRPWSCHGFSWAFVALPCRRAVMVCHDNMQCHPSIMAWGRHSISIARHWQCYGSARGDPMALPWDNFMETLHGIAGSPFNGKTWQCHETPTVEFVKAHENHGTGMEDHANVMTAVRLTIIKAHARDMRSVMRMPDCHGSPPTILMMYIPRQVDMKFLAYANLERIKSHGVR